MRTIAPLLLALSQCAGCALQHGEHYTVKLSPNFTPEQVQGIRDAGADWQKWVPVTFTFEWAGDWRCEEDYTMCVFPVTSEYFEDPAHMWGFTRCSAMKSDSCRIALAIDRKIGDLEWQALAAHEMGHAMGSREPQFPNRGHEPQGSGALMTPYLEGLNVTCTDMARWYTARKEVVPTCPL